MLAALAIAIALAPSPDEVFANGQQLYQEGKFEEAADAIEQAYTLDPRPEFLYAWAQAERRAGDCRAAVDLYEQFLATQPPDDLAEFARENQRVCARELAQAEPPPPRVEPPPPTPPPRDAPPKPPPWHRDPLGGALLGIGIAAVATGIGLRVGAESARGRADATDMHSHYDQQIRNARALAGGGIGTLAAGGALIVGAAIRYAIVARRRRA
jgi:tetratricopeptide (TPR) repeat protein